MMIMNAKISVIIGIALFLLIGILFYPAISSTVSNAQTFGSITEYLSMTNNTPKAVSNAPIHSFTSLERANVSLSSNKVSNIFNYSLFKSLSTNEASPFGTANLTINCEYDPNEAIGVYVSSNYFGDINTTNTCPHTFTNISQALIGDPYTLLTFGNTGQDIYQLDSNLTNVSEGIGQRNITLSQKPSTDGNLTIKSDYVSGEQISVYLNGVLKGNLSSTTDVWTSINTSNMSKNQKLNITFTNDKSSKLMNASNGTSINSSNFMDVPVIKTIDGNGANMSVYYDKNASKGENVSVWFNGHPVKDLGKNIVVGYDFNENDGLIASDNNNLNNGTLTGYGANGTWVAGKIGNAVGLDGVGNYVVTPSINLGQTQSFSFWYKPNSTGSNNEIILEAGASIGNANTVNIWHEVGVTAMWCSLTNSTNDRVNAASSTSTFTAGTWYYIACVLDASQIRFFINGINEGNATISTAGDLNGDIAIGRSQNGGTGGMYADGSIDEVRIFNKSLSQAEITKIYQNGLNNKSGDVEYYTTPSDIDAGWENDYSEDTIRVAFQGDLNNETVISNISIDYVRVMNATTINNASFSYDYHDYLSNFTNASLLYNRWSGYSNYTVNLSGFLTAAHSGIYKAEYIYGSSLNQTNTLMLNLIPILFIAFIIFIGYQKFKD